MPSLAAQIGPRQSRRARRPKPGQGPRQWPWQAFHQIGGRNMSDTETKAAEKPEGKQERLTDLRHSDELDFMTSRLWGLNTAIRGLEGDCSDEPALSGVIRLAE